MLAVRTCSRARTHAHTGLRWVQRDPGGVGCVWGGLIRSEWSTLASPCHGGCLTLAGPQQEPPRRQRNPPEMKQFLIPRGGQSSVRSGAVRSASRPGDQAPADTRRDVMKRLLMMMMRMLMMMRKMKMMMSHMPELQRNAGIWEATRDSRSGKTLEQTWKSRLRWNEGIRKSPARFSERMRAVWAVMFCRLGRNVLPVPAASAPGRPR